MQERKSKEIFSNDSRFLVALWGMNIMTSSKSLQHQHEARICKYSMHEMLGEIIDRPIHPVRMRYDTNLYSDYLANLKPYVIANIQLDNLLIWKNIKKLGRLTHLNSTECYLLLFVLLLQSNKCLFTLVKNATPYVYQPLPVESINYNSPEFSIMKKLDNEEHMLCKLCNYTAIALNCELSKVVDALKERLFDSGILSYSSNERSCSVFETLKPSPQIIPHSFEKYLFTDKMLQSRFL